MAGRTTAPTTSMLSMKRKPRASTTYPIRPSTPVRFTWRRYMPVMPASDRTAKQHLHGLADLPLGRGDEVEVQVGVVDLDADVQQAPDDGGDAGRAGEGGGGDGHVRLLVRGPRRGAAG